MHRWSLSIYFVKATVNNKYRISLRRIGGLRNPLSRFILITTGTVTSTGGRWLLVVHINILLQLSCDQLFTHLILLQDDSDGRVDTMSLWVTASGGITIIELDRLSLISDIMVLHWFIGSMGQLGQLLCKAFTQRCVHLIVNSASLCIYYTVSLKLRDNWNPYNQSSY